MRAQKPPVPRGGAFAALARVGAAGGAEEFVDVGTGEASVAVAARNGQGLARELVTLRKLTHASRVTMERVAVWRNWQTQQTQNLPELCSVWVQVPPPPP